MRQPSPYILFQKQKEYKKDRQFIKLYFFISLVFPAFSSKEGIPTAENYPCHIFTVANPPQSQ
jgi:hypothetical protein